MTTLMFIESKSRYIWVVNEVPILRLKEEIAAILYVS